MAQVGTTKSIDFTDGSSWTMQTMTDTETGVITQTVYGADGKEIKSGTPEEVSASFSRNAESFKDSMPGASAAMARAAAETKAAGDAAKSALVPSETPKVFKESDLNKPKELGTLVTDEKTSSNKVNEDKIPEVVVTAKRDTKSANRTYNPLGRFSSYTYKLSLYMLTGDAITAHNTTGVWNTKNMQLVAQSAGVNTSLDSPRASGFEFDYYIDNLDIITAVGAGHSGFSGTTTDITFDIFEPYGMTFPSKLLAAAKALKDTSSGGAATQLGDAMSQFYLLVIRFFGYDEKGAIVKSPAAALGTDNKTDDVGLFERAFPIVINEMKTRLDNKMVRYSITATPNNQKVALSQFTGTVGEQITISGDTVGSILGTGETGLVGILNKKEAELVKNKKKEVADIYDIKFEDLTKIETALLVDKNHYVPSQTPLTGVPSAVNVRVAESGRGATVSKQKRSIQVPSGTRIPQAIEQVISQSTYISDCLSVINKEESQPVQENDETSVTNASPKEFAWFTVTSQVEPLKKDEQLNVRANKITYYVKKYSMPFVRSPYFDNKSKYPGPHKIYNYWYSGANEGVLSFDITYNQLYSSIANLFGSGNVKNKDNLPMRLSSSSGGDTQGKQPGTSEEVSSFKTWLYSPDEQQKANLKILGDPDFLMTASFGSFADMDQKNPGTEAPINPLNGQVFIELDLRSVSDYSDKDGLLKPEQNLIFWDYSKELQEKTQGRMIFVVVIVRSKFSRGLFTQEFPELALPTNLDSGSSSSSSESSNQREGGKGTTLDPAKAAQARKDFAATDPRRLDKSRSTEDDNGFVSNNNSATNEGADQRQPFVGYRVPVRRKTNKETKLGE